MTVVVRLGPAPTWPRMQIVKQGLSRIETLRIKDLLLKIAPSQRKKWSFSIMDYDSW